jgi:hypothetical protein
VLNALDRLDVRSSQDAAFGELLGHLTGGFVGSYPSISQLSYVVGGLKRVSESSPLFSRKAVLNLMRLVALLHPQSCASTSLCTDMVHYMVQRIHDRDAGQYLRASIVALSSVLGVLVYPLTVWGQVGDLSQLADPLCKALSEQSQVHDLCCASLAGVLEPVPPPIPVCVLPGTSMRAGLSVPVVRLAFQAFAADGLPCVPSAIYAGARGTQILLELPTTSALQALTEFMCSRKHSALRLQPPPPELVAVLSSTSANHAHTMARGGLHSVLQAVLSSNVSASSRGGRLEVLLAACRLCEDEEPSALQRTLLASLPAGLSICVEALQDSARSSWKGRELAARVAQRVCATPAYSAMVEQFSVRTVT